MLRPLSTGVIVARVCSLTGGAQRAWSWFPRAVGIVIVLCAGLPSDTPAAEDLSRLIAELSEAWQQGRSKDIVDRFDRALQLIPQDYRVHKAYGDFLTANRRNQEALAAYRRAAELAPDALDVHWATWSLLDRMGAQDKAIVSLKEIVRIDPDNPLTHLRLARALRNVDRLEESVDAYEQAVRLDPDHMGYRLWYARALFDVLRYEEARREVESVLARAPHDAPERVAALNLIGLVKGESSEKGRRADATEGIASSGIDPVRGKQWALTRDRAWQLMRASRYAEAEPVLREVLAIMPRDYKAHYDLGLVLMELGRYEAAIDSFREGIRISKFGEWYPDSVFLIGLCLTKLGRWHEAVSRFERVLEIQDWQNEDGYGMTFPDLRTVRASLEEARRHLSLEPPPAGERADLAVELIRPRSETNPMPALDPRPPLPESMPVPTHVAVIGMGDAQGWFRQMVPARGVVQDDLPTGLQEFIPIWPTDTFAPDDPEIIIVFTLTSVPYDEITLTTRWVIERAGTVSPHTLIGTDRALLTLNDKSGYTRLKRPKEGWPIGMYRVDFYVGDQLNAYTHTAEARFRVVTKASP